MASTASNGGTRAARGHFAADPETNEQVRLLNQLARADGTSHQVKQDAVIQKVPEWGRLEQAGIIPPGATCIMCNLHALSFAERSALVKSESQIPRIMLETLYVDGDLHACQYVLTLLYETVRDDSSHYESMWSALQGMDIFGAFNQVLERPGIDSYAADKAAYMLSGFISRAPSGSFSTDHVQYFVQALIHGRASNKYLVSEGGRLDALSNLLKIDGYRKLIWNTRGIPDMLMKNLFPSTPSGLAYKAIFCCWLLSFNKDTISPMLQQGIITAVCKILRESRVEKVVRMCLHMMKNILKDEGVVEIVIEVNLMQALTLLEFEKWRDPELYDEIRESTHQLDQKLKNFSSFDRYCRELEDGSLKWSVLHSEKFWHENVLAFEQDEFAAIQKIVKLLKSSDSTTLAVACHDLGEFARLHPAGKLVCQKLKVKDMVMLLISSKDREVAREALLCLQKLMLNHWQDLSKAGKK